MSTVPRYRESLIPIPMGGVENPEIVYVGTREALIISESHYKLPDGSWSGGGPFYQCRQTLRHQGIMAYDNWAFGAHFRGNAGCVAPGPKSPPPFSVPSWAQKSSDLSGHYATGFKRTRPGNPVAGLGQFIVELRDLPKIPFSKGLKGGNFGVPIHQVPRILYERLKDYRSLGSEYLNIQFGWMPFVSDLRKMYNLWKTIDKRMAQLVRENGKYIRRKASLENDVTTTQETFEIEEPWWLVWFTMPLAPNLPQKHSTWSSTRTTETKRWFSGSYRYYIPDVGSSLWDARARAALFGALPTPELLWNVLPWSWLVDWFGNVGDVISNASTNAVDNLTLRYSFVMEHIRDTQEWRCHTEHSPATNGGPGSFGYLHSGGGRTFKTTLLSESKARLGGGNPFGLNVQLPSLSAYQLSILAALGISRGAVK